MTVLKLLLVIVGGIIIIHQVLARIVRRFWHFPAPAFISHKPLARLQNAGSSGYATTASRDFFETRRIRKQLRAKWEISGEIPASKTADQPCGLEKGI